MRYLNFITQIKTSKRKVLKQLFHIVSSDCRSTTGSNLRNILLLTDYSSIDSLWPATYIEELIAEDLLKVDFTLEIIDVKNGIREIPEGLQRDELDDILQFICAD